MTFFERIKEEPLDPILGINIHYTADKRENKVNLGAGVYKTKDLKPFILNSVKKAEALLLEKEHSKDYLPIDGLHDYVQLTKELVFENREIFDCIYGAQTVGGTAALAVGARLLKECGLNNLYLSSPTWANHRRIFHDAGLNVHTYSYFNWKKKAFDFEAFLKEIDQMQKHSIVLLQVCCHNPTGLDPALDEWKHIYEKIEKKELFPFFDFAYQGFGTNLKKDAASLSLFLQRQKECMVAVSHAKNFGLYAERCGALFVVGKENSDVKRIGSRVKTLIRGLYSNPPCHGARIVATILQNEELKREWINELALMRDRITDMRSALTQRLHEKSSSSMFDFLTEQKGMFSYTALKEKQIENLIETYGIYLPKDGRINVAGLNDKNLEYVVDALLSVCI